MLNRRNLRIKAMQTLFAWQQLRNSDQQIAWEQFQTLLKEAPDSVPEPAKLERPFKSMLIQSDRQSLNDLPPDIMKSANEMIADYQIRMDNDLANLRLQMLKEVEGINQLFLWILGLFVALADFEKLVISRKKPLSNGKPQTVLGHLHSIELIRKATKSLNLPSWEVHQDRLSQWYKDIKNASGSGETSEKPTSLEDEVNKLRSIFKTILWKSDSFQNFFEEHDRGWVENKDIIKSLVNKTLRSITEEGLVLAPLSYQWEEDKQFFMQIFDATLKGEAWTENLIAERAKNWEMDRIAQVDMILLKMAITEMINFPSIPVKVTINEYIELSKKYSTPKSKKFINGILDVLADHLTEKGTIKKSGRGLIDNK